MGTSRAHTSKAAECDVAMTPIETPRLLEGADTDGDTSSEQKGGAVT